ncbi:MAG: hypothetical protein Q8L56_07890 [Rhodocyclaceae bacterium]|nr:hypothetical protein [Rhodocyclaceae bacterium]
MNMPMIEAARHVPHMMSNPMTGGAMMAAGGYAAGKGLLDGLLRNPLVFLAAGVAAGYLLFKYEKEIIETVSKATGMGKDFMLHQKENLDDLIAESQPTPAAPVTSAVPAAPTQE